MRAATGHIAGRSMLGSRWHRSPVVGAFCLLMVLVGARGGWAQPLWGEMNLPGGTQAVRQLFALGSDEGRARGELLLDFGHRYFGWYAQVSVAQAFVQYVTFLQSVNDAAQGWPDGCRLLASNATRQQRNRVKDYVELLGLRQRDVRGKLAVELDENKDARERVKWLRAASIDVDDLILRLNAGDSVKVEIRA